MKDFAPWNLELYVAGSTPRSLIAFSNLESICKQHLAGQYRIEVIDLLKNPQLAAGYQIVMVPTLIRKSPEPVKRIMGDMSDTKRVIAGLDIPLPAQ